LKFPLSEIILPFSSKAAVADIPGNAYFQSVQETTANNAGRTWKLFTDIDAERAWLKGK
jgi:hypothetical protein